MPRDSEIGSPVRAETGLIKRAFDIAYAKHRGQLDKGGVKYINHPVYVSSHMHTVEEKVVALLHDVVEDTDTDLGELSEFGPRVLDALDAITRRPGEDYFDYILRVKENPIARAVKIEDLRHNMRMDRIPDPTERDFARVNKYHTALGILAGQEVQHVSKTRNE